ncbi:hypothetical protein OEA41_009751 [Lepraria neglecta]|uniref:Uncharacterized protein n=1 Tax=Lepraria neglecta TaxID=209136 RepID=A0AAE0DI21_9LECA|nr:hypothetical protein OEA41_009751 [Lepraria neglecta]
MDFETGSPEKMYLREVIHKAANALAADRATTSLPIIVAQCFFIGAVGIAVGRTASAARASSDNIFVNVEAHSIAYSALYFWVIPAVFVSSVIGVSRTKANIPRILKDFQAGLDGIKKGSINLRNECLDDNQWRISHGGICSWNPSKWQWKTRAPSNPGHITNTTSGQPHLPGSRYQPASQNSTSESPTEHVERANTTENQQTASGTPVGGHWTRVFRTILSYLIVILGAVTGMIVSARVPPDGWDC